MPPDSQPLTPEQLRARREEAARRQSLQMRQQTNRINQQRMTLADGSPAPSAPAASSWRKVSEVHTSTSSQTGRSAAPNPAMRSSAPAPAARSNPPTQPVGRSTVKAIPVSRGQIPTSAPAQPPASPPPPAAPSPAEAPAVRSVPAEAPAPPPDVPVVSPSLGGPPPKPVVLKMKVQELELPEAPAAQLPAAPGARVTNSISQMADSYAGPTSFAPLIAGVTAPVASPAAAPPQLSPRVEDRMPSLRMSEESPAPPPQSADPIPALRMAGDAAVAPATNEMPELHLATEATPMPPEIAPVLRLANPPQPPPIPGSDVEQPPPLPLMPVVSQAPPHMMQTPPPLPADLPPMERPPPPPKPPDDSDLSAPELFCPKCEVLIPESHRGSYFTACPKCGEIFKMK